jgi:hypothetical protein
MIGFFEDELKLMHKLLRTALVGGWRSGSGHSVLIAQPIHSVSFSAASL